MSQSLPQRILTRVLPPLHQPWPLLAAEQPPTHHHHHQQ
jgi:hypothetical protein